MKQNQLVKFSLSLVCAAVLAACSSGGGSDNSAAKAAEEAKVAAAEKAAAEKAAAEAAAKKAAEEAAAKEAAAKAEAAVKDSSSQGHKFVKKSESNFVLDKFETSSKSQGSQSNMDVKLHKSLDTVVVSIPLVQKANGEFVRDEKQPIGYVEDFDFRKDAAALATARANGKTTLSNIYKTANGSTLNGAARTQVAGPAPRTVAESIEIRNVTKDTKTVTKGAQTGEVLVYQTGRTNYIGTDEVVKGSNTALANSTNKDFRDRSKTVAEVYGHRTFVQGTAETGVDSATVDTGVNAPFGELNGSAANGTYKAVKLNNVQYGRVTSKLHDVDPKDTKAGIATGTNGTKVVSYGEYNAKGTENNYFYRGVNDTAYSATLANDLAGKYATTVNGAKTPAGSLTYQGHAVTYGFTHVAPNVDLPDTSKVPNAVRPNIDYDKPALVSGTHVAAKIDLATKNVTGNLYDVWSVGGVKTTQDIAQFSGSLANSGEITGTSTRVSDKAAGSFAGNLFGKNAEELGGGIASKATDAAKSWGATFGAKVQNDLYNAPAPQAKPTAWGVQTDEINK